MRLEAVEWLSRADDDDDDDDKDKLTGAEKVRADVVADFAAWSITQAGAAHSAVITTRSTCCSNRHTVTTITTETTWTQSNNEIHTVKSNLNCYCSQLMLVYQFSADTLCCPPPDLRPSELQLGPGKRSHQF